MTEKEKLIKLLEDLKETEQFKGSTVFHSCKQIGLNEAIKIIKEKVKEINQITPEMVDYVNPNENINDETMLHLLNMSLHTAKRKDDSDVVRIISRAINHIQNLIADKKADEWQDIDSAPKDGTQILIYNSRHKKTNVACWADDEAATGNPSWVSVVDGNYSYDEEGYITDLWNPTHWKHLPPPPPKECK